MIVLGIDASLTGCGVSDGRTFADVLDTGKLAGHERVEEILRQVSALMRGHGTEEELPLVVIEGPSYGSLGARQHEVAGLWWMITHGLWQGGIPYAVAPPTTRMKYATGNGQAAKERVLSAVIRRYPDFVGDNNNQADAWVLACMGRDRYGLPTAVLPDQHRSALKGVAWPDGVSR